MDSFEEKEESHENFLKSDEIFEDPILNPSKYLKHSSYHLESDMSFADSNCFMGERILILIYLSLF